jgi:hypothetical protein
MPATGALERHARIHEGEDAAADAGHAGGTVGFHDFAADAQGVGEVVLARDDRLDAALGERAVADLATTGRAGAAGFTDGEGREVVMEDEALRRGAAGVTVEFLRFLRSWRGSRAEGLVSPPGKERAAVAARDHANFAAELADVIGTADQSARTPLSRMETRKAFLLQRVEGLADLERRGLREFLEDGFLDFVLECVDRLDAVPLLGV